MKDIRAEKSPGMDLPYYIEMATGDAGLLYAVDTISSLTVTDWADGAIVDLAIIYSFSGSIILLRISGGIEGTTYQIKVKVNFANPDYKDEVFVTLYCRKPVTS